MYAKDTFLIFPFWTPHFVIWTPHFGWTPWLHYTPADTQLRQLKFHKSIK